jgi:hypothetical protein
MTKYVKEHFQLSTILFSLLLIFCLYSFLSTPVYAAEPDIQDKTIAILDEIVGINTAEYGISLDSLSDDQFHSLPQKEVYITLASAEGRFGVRTSFVNNNLRRIYISYPKLPVEYPAVDTTVEMAKGLLESYQNYTGDSFYGELTSMLDDVDATKNTTKSAGNIKLTVSNTHQKNVNYVWTYTDENGIIAESKNVILSYERGRLKTFTNNWPLYTVAGTPKISGEEATAIAIEVSKNYSYEVSTENDTLTVTGFEIAPESLGHEALSYLNNPDPSLARGGDPFTLYPSWYVPIGFVKSYPGAVTGIRVTVWADTGEVSITEPMVVTLFSETPADEEAIKDGFNQCSTMLAVPIAITALFSVFGVALVSRKKVKFAGSRKLFPRLWAALMCGILFSAVLFSVVMVATPPVAAIVNPNSKADIYAAYDTDPPQNETEKEAANNVTTYIKTYFEESGYIADNWAGEDTTKTRILENAEYNELNYDRAAVFHFGHHSEFNIGYQDNNGTDVWSDDIDSYIDLQKHDFVFLWVCTQAQSNASNGTAAAWTQRMDLSSDGYGDSDHEGQVYIGFWGFSPQINNHTAFKGTTTAPLQYWIERFYYYALNEPLSVKEALDQASDALWGKTFDQSILFKEPYEAWWPGVWNGTDWVNRGYWEGKMNVFGDAEIFVFQPTMTISATTGGATFPSGTYRYTYGHSEDVIAQTMDPEHYPFSHWELNGVPYSGSESISIEVKGNYNLTAVFTYDPTYRLAIYAYPGGTTNPEPGLYNIPVGTPVYVTAIPDDGYDFDYWILEGNQYNDETISFLMLGDYTLEAHFIRKYCLTIQSWYGGHTVPSAGEYYYQSGSYAEVTAYVDDPEHFYWGYWILDGQDYLNDTTITIQMYSDHTLKPMFIYYEQYCLTIQSSYGGHTVPSAGEYYYPEDTDVPVTAYVDDPENWEWSHWMLDGQQSSSSFTITVQMDSDHTLKPIWIYDPQIEYHDLTLVYMAWFWGHWIYLGGGTSSLPEDYYMFTAPSTVYGLDFVCWDYEGNYYPDQTITIFLDSDQYLAAIYVPS